MKLNITIIQMEIEDGNKTKNISRSLGILKSLNNSKLKPDIVCFPELFTTGYDLKYAKEHSEPIPGPTIEKIAEISKGNYIVIGSILEIKNGNYYNTAFILSKDGKIIGKYSKIQLFSPMSEKKWLKAGDKISTFSIPELSDLKIGIAICYEIRFPEIFRIMALNDVRIIFIPSEFPTPKREVWITLNKARAIENQVFIIGINRVGDGSSDHFFGSSIITNGDYSEILSENEEIKTIQIDLNSLDTIRETLPLLNDRRSDLY